MYIFHLKSICISFDAEVHSITQTIIKKVLNICTRFGIFIDITKTERVAIADLPM